MVREPFAGLKQGALLLMVIHLLNVGHHRNKFQK